MLLTRKRKILAKIETVAGTDAAPVVATDAVLCRSINVTPLNVNYDERTLVRPTLGGFEQTVADKMVKLEITLELIGFGAPGTTGPTPIPGYDALLRACGLASVLTAGTDNEYNPISSGFESATIYYEKDGVLEKALMCRGTWDLSMAVGKIPTIKLTMSGVYGGLADQDIGVPDTSAYLKPVAVNSVNTTGFSILGFATAKLRSLDLSQGNTVDLTTYVGDAETISITDRATTGKISIQATTKAAHDWLADVLNVATGALALTHGPAGNQVVLGAPKVQLTNPQESDDKGIAFLDFDLRLMPDLGDDDFTIKMQ